MTVRGEFDRVELVIPPPALGIGFGLGQRRPHSLPIDPFALFYYPYIVVAARRIADQKKCAVGPNRKTGRIADPVVGPGITPLAGTRLGI